MKAVKSSNNNLDLIKAEPILNKDLISIKPFYEKAYKLIKDNNMKYAKNVLFSEMPANLYDLSIDISSNKNKQFTDKPLRRLIKKVHKKLENEEIESLNIVEDDNFGGFI
jgi:hypothetical protein